MKVEFENYSDLIEFARGITAEEHYQEIEGIHQGQMESMASANKAIRELQEKLELQQEQDNPPEYRVDGWRRFFKYVLMTDPGFVRAWLISVHGEGNKIQQIKALREVSGCGLKDAKDFVEGEAVEQKVAQFL